MCSVFKKTYLSILIIRPLPWINVDIILKQHVNTLDTSFTDTKLEEGNLIGGGLAYLSMVV